MAPFIAPSSDLALTIGEIERKVDMSLDDIIKQSKRMDKRQHTKVKNRNRTQNMQPNNLVQMQKIQQSQQTNGHRPFRRGLQQKRELQQRRVAQQRKDLLQRFVALRSSALRQEKLKEARARTGTSSMAVARKPAGCQVLPNNVVAPLTRFSRKAAQGSMGLLRTTARPKMLIAARNTKTVIVNKLSMNGAARRPAVQVVSVPRRMPIQPQKRIWRSNKVMAHAPVRRPQTLDSRFATLREERFLNSQFGSHAAWRQ